jgi:Spy/CpxP family protein refolding chaperone
MRKSVFAVLVVLISFSPIFAQNLSTNFSNREDVILKSLKLSDTQISQVKEIEKSVMSEVRADRANIQLLNAQIKVALLPSTTGPDLNAIDKLIDQKAALRASVQKALVASQAKLVQIIGQDNFDSFMRMHHEFFARNRTMARRATFGEKSEDGNTTGFGGGVLQ